MNESQVRSEDTRIGQPFNPFRLFTGIFIPDGMVRSTSISPGAKLTYARLTRYAGQDGKCYPAVETLATEIALSARQAQRYLAELEREHLVRRITRYCGRAQTSNGFEFLWHEMFQERLLDRAGEGVTTVAPHRVTDPSPHPVTDPSPKESQIEESHLKEKHRQADSRHASPKTGEGSRRRGNHNQDPGLRICGACKDRRRRGEAKAHLDRLGCHRRQQQARGFHGRRTAASEPALLDHPIGGAIQAVCRRHPSGPKRGLEPERPAGPEESAALLEMVLRSPAECFHSRLRRAHPRGHVLSTGSTE